MTRREEIVEFLSSMMDQLAEVPDVDLVETSLTSHTFEDRDTPVPKHKCLDMRASFRIRLE